MSWMIHFNGEDYGPLTDGQYNDFRIRLNKVSVSGGGVGFRFPIGDGVDAVGTAVGVREFFWTPGAPISFTHLS